MKENFITGINEDGLGNLSFEILDYVDDISKIFDEIDSCVDSLPNYLQGDMSLKIIKKYNELSENYTIVKENLRSYSEDLIALIHKTHENEEYSALLFDELTTEIKREEKLKENGGI